MKKFFKKKKAKDVVLSRVSFTQNRDEKEEEEEDGEEVAIARLKKEGMRTTTTTTTSYFLEDRKKKFSELSEKLVQKLSFREILSGDNIEDEQLAEENYVKVRGILSRELLSSVSNLILVIQRGGETRMRGYSRPFRSGSTHEQEMFVDYSFRCFRERVREKSNEIYVRGRR